MLYKNLPLSSLLPVILIRLFLDGFAGIKFLSEGHWKDCLAVVRAHFHFYGRMIGGQLKRGKNRPVNKHNCIYKRSIVIDHYIRKKDKFNQLKFHPRKDNL